MVRLKRPGSRASASGPHRFVPPPDPRMGLALGGQSSGPEGSPIPGIAVAEASLRPQACAQPGCGRDRDDPIHWPAD